MNETASVAQPIADDEPVLAERARAEAICRNTAARIVQSGTALDRFAAHMLDWAADRIRDGSPPIRSEY